MRRRNSDRLAPHGCTAVSRAMWRNMLHNPTIAIVRMQECGIAGELVRSIFVKNLGHPAVAEQRKRAALSHIVGSASKISNVQVRCRLASRLIPQGGHPIAVSNKGIELKVRQDCRAKLPRKRIRRWIQSGRCEDGDEREHPRDHTDLMPAFHRFWDAGGRVRQGTAVAPTPPAAALS